MRDPHKAVVYVMLRLHTNTSQYSHWCFTVLEEKLYKWATLLYIMQLGTVHPNRGSAHYSFPRLPNFFCFLTWVIHPSFLWVYQKFTDRLYHTDHTHTKKKPTIVKGSENVLSSKAQKQLEFIQGGITRGKGGISPHQSVLHQPFQPQSGISVVIVGFSLRTSKSRIPIALNPFCLSTKMDYTSEPANVAQNTSISWHLKVLRTSHFPQTQLPRGCSLQDQAVDDWGTTVPKPQQVTGEAKRELAVYHPLVLQVTTNSPKKCRYLTGVRGVLLRLAWGPKGVDWDSGPAFSGFWVGVGFGFLFPRRHFQ